MLGFHAFADNDYVLLFFTKGKATERRRLKMKRSSKVGRRSSVRREIPQELFEVIKEFVYSIYGLSCSSVNKVTVKMFSKRLS